MGFRNSNGVIPSVATDLGVGRPAALPTGSLAHARDDTGFLLLAILLFATPLFASVSVRRSAGQPKKIDVAIQGESLSDAVKALAAYLPHRAQMVLGKDPQVTFSAPHVEPEAALRAVVLSAGATLSVDGGQYWIRMSNASTVTIDVKDEDIQKILKSMQAQCGIRNLVIDRDVQGKGTFLFDRLPCRQAFDIVFRTMSLASVDYPNSVMTVGLRRR